MQPRFPSAAIAILPSKPSPAANGPGHSFSASLSSKQQTVLRAIAFELFRKGKKVQNPNIRNACSIGHRDIRAVLTDEQLHKLEGVSRWKSYRAGEPIFQEGDTTTHSFIVVAGALKLTRIHPGGERYVIGLMFTDDLLCRAFKPRHSCSAEAAVDLTLCAMPAGAVLSLCEEAPKLERVLFRAALSELEANHDCMLLLRGCSAYQRVAGFLSFLAVRSQPSGRAALNGEGVQTRFTLPLSRAEIAGFLGITVETVCRQMTLMRKRGVIELRDNREVFVPNLGILSAHAERDPLSEGRFRTTSPAFANPAGTCRAAAL
jgi:CRP/FNR family transcriptional regulator, anaerobic regulatory protein